jgi:signal peptidase II
MSLRLRGLIAAFVTLVLDQVSKLAVLRHFADVPDALRDLPLLPGLDIREIGNRGVTFGLFNGAGEAGQAELIFSGMTLVIVAVLLVTLVRTQRSLGAIGLGMVIGGAIGNLIDRVRLGAVVDFLDFHIGSWHWYVFNGADAAICIGVGILLLDGLPARTGSPKKTAL